MLHDTPLMPRHAPRTGRGGISMTVLAPVTCTCRVALCVPVVLPRTGRRGISMPVLWDQVTQLPARLPAVQKPGALLHRYRCAHVTVVLPCACNCNTCDVYLSCCLPSHVTVLLPCIRTCLRKAATRRGATETELAVTEHALDLMSC